MLRNWKQTLGTWLHRPVLLCGLAYIIVSAVVFAATAMGPLVIAVPGPADSPYYLLISLHFLYGLVLFIASLLPTQGGFVRRRLHSLAFIPEALFFFGLLLFLFAYVFAMNAEMDYVQRFIASSGNLRLALDTRTERAQSAARFLPLMLVNLPVYFYFRIGRRQLANAVLPGSWGFGRFAFGWVAVAVLLSVFAQPSFLRLEGIPWLAWISLVPLLLVWRFARFGVAWFYGVAYGVTTTLLTNYWLGTFSLVSLQFVTVVFLGYYIVFSPILLLLYRRTRVARYLILPFAWTGFELVRSSGFLGYPWALIGHSQWSLVPLIQISDITGVWGVTFLIVLVNAALAEHAGSRLIGTRGLDRWQGRPLRVAAIALAASLLYGAASLSLEHYFGPPTYDTARVALIQQNSDPRKHDYDDTLNTLIRLTNQSLEAEPDLIVWSETAFVPNIRRWSQEDPQQRHLARLVERFLDHQQQSATYLVTGNDDYELVLNDDGQEIDRLNYNAAVLFSDTGERKQTYHKIRLVPFTEYFPYENTLPWVYDMLLDFDVHFWEPGSERIVFEHPKFAFATPICFEDVFSDDVRRFVLNGAEVIVNLTNDYWSLNELQAKQHFAGGMFRAVENRRPVVRGTASGLTAVVDEFGRIEAQLDYYVEDYLVHDVQLRSRGLSIYTRFGDWFPFLSLLAAPLLWFVSRFYDRRSQRVRVGRFYRRFDGG